MNKLIVYPLMILVGLFMFNAIYSLQPMPISSVSSSTNQTYPSNMTVTWNYTHSSSRRGKTLLGSLVYHGNGGVTTFGINYGLGILLVLGTLLAVGIAIGIRIFGSGLSETAQQITYKTTVYLVFWGFFSPTALGLLVAIPFFGWLIYAVLTVFYALGIVDSIGGTHPT
jgi:hypothetical protein